MPELTTRLATTQLAVVVAAVPVRPDRAQGREWLQRELAGREYVRERPGVLERVVQWVFDQLDRLQLGGAGSLRPAAIAVAITVLLAVIGFAIHRSGGFRRQARARDAAVLDDAGTTAAQHRADAERAAAAGDWDAAVVARFRALARGLEERTFLAEQPGRTAREVAREAGRLLPDEAAALVRAADSFDLVSYGHRHVGSPAYTDVLDLDERLAVARLLVST